MIKREYELGEELSLAGYIGNVVEKTDKSIIVQFKTWASINPWTGAYPRIEFKYDGLLDKVENE